MRLEEALARVLDAERRDIFTALPAIVQVYDPTLRTVDVQPAVRRPVSTEAGDVDHEELPIIPAVRVGFPCGSGVSISWTLQPGDHVLLVATTYAIGQWLATGKLSDAGDVRQHHPGSCVALPLMPPGGVLPGEIVIEAATIKLGAAAVDPIANGAASQAWIDAIVSAIVGLGGAVVPPVEYPTTAHIRCAKAVAE